MRSTTSKSAFTLIEVLTVIALLSVLAGLLVPAILSARWKAREAQMGTDISNIETNVKMYLLDFGVFPPDELDLDGDGTIDPDELDKPSECLVYFLGKKFRKSSTNGMPIAWATADDLDPTSFVIHAQINAGPYMEFNAAQVTDSDGDGLEEFIGPLGIPYCYNAPGGRWGDPVHNPSSVDIFHVGRNERTHYMIDPNGSVSSPSNYAWTENYTSEELFRKLSDGLLLYNMNSNRALGNDTVKGQLGGSKLRDANPMPMPDYDDDGDADDQNNW